MIEEFKTLMEYAMTTPLQLLLSILLIASIIYYFCKVAPKRFNEFQKVNNDRNEDIKMISKIAGQYEKLVENSTRVVENNTATLQNTQKVLELVAEKTKNATEEITRMETDIQELANRVNDISVSIAQINGKLDK